MSQQTLNVKPLLETAGKDRGVEVCSAKAMRLAVFRFIADALGAAGEERAEAWKAFEADTPGWFGSNASAGMAALGLKGKESAVEAEFKP
jgi:hypothetical protein